MANIALSVTATCRRSSSSAGAGLLIWDRHTANGVFCVAGYVTASLLYRCVMRPTQPETAMSNEREIELFKEFSGACCNHRVITPEIEQQLRRIQQTDEIRERVIRHGRAA